MAKKLNPEMTYAENPVWSAKDSAEAMPASNIVVGGLFGNAQGTEMLKPRRGRPKSATTKERVNLRFDPGVLEQFRASGPGWQTRMNAALADGLKTHTPDELKALSPTRGRVTDRLTHFSIIGNCGDFDHS